jgi:hypothetical protein
MNLLAMRSVQDVVGNEGVALYIFGSALQTLQPDDLDLLIVYDNRLLSVENALSFRRGLSKSITDALELPADLVLLSKCEAQQSRFVELEGAVRVSISRSEPNSSCCGRRTSSDNVDTST